MPKQSRGYRRYKKRYYKYKFNKYSHRRQKLTLSTVNRKLNRYIYNTRPEWTQVRGIAFDVHNKNGEALQYQGCGTYSLYEWILNVYNRGGGRPERSLVINNEFLRSYKLVLTGGFSLCPTDRILLKDDQTPPNYHDFKPYPSDVYMRIVVVRYLKERDDALPCGNLFENTSLPGEPEGLQEISIINGPLKKGITGAVKILKTKVIKLSLNRPSRLFKMTIKLPHYRKVINDMNNIGAGEIGIFYSFVIPTYVAQTPEFIGRVNYQFVYVDQN